MPTLESAPTPAELRTGWPRRGVVGVLALCLVLTGWFFAEKYWPYRYSKVKPLLENVFASKITVEQYRRIYFPHPGFVAHGLVLQRHITGNPPPIGSAEDVRVTGSWGDLLLLRNRVELVEVDGLRVVIPPVGSAANQADFPAGSSADFAGPTTAIAELHISRSELDIQRVDGGTYAYPIRDLAIRNLQKGKTLTYVVDMQNASPSGRIQSSGSFGPLRASSLGTTALAGHFNFTAGKLSEIGTLHGTLTVADSFSGQLDQVQVEATAAVPDFAVGEGRASPVGARLQCTVNALTGDVVLQGVDVTTGASTVHAEGSIMAASAGAPKTTNLTFSVQNGRVQDLMRPFLHDKVPLTGPVWLGGKAVLAPAQRGATFLDRLQATGSLNAPAGRLTDRRTAESLAAFSQRAQGVKAAEADPEVDVVSSLAGQTRVAKGVVSTGNLSFAVPGAVTRVSGTYDLVSTAAHFTGTLTMDSDISHVTTGLKSVLLKPLAPFFRRGQAGAVVPIAVTGAAGRYKVTQNVIPLR